MKLTCLFYQHQVDAGQILGKFSEIVYDYPFVPAKDIKSEVVLLLNFGDVNDGCRSVMPSKLSVMCGVFSCSVHMIPCWESRRAKSPPETFVVLDFHIKDSLLVPHS